MTTLANTPEGVAFFETVANASRLLVTAMSEELSFLTFYSLVEAYEFVKKAKAFPNLEDLPPLTLLEGNFLLAGQKLYFEKLNEVKE